MFLIGKITLDGNYNYGNKLQNYALQEFLLRFGKRVDTLIHDERDFAVSQTEGTSFTWKEWIKLIINWKGFRSRLSSGMSGRDAIRSYRISLFDRKYICSRHLHGGETLQSAEREYDVFVTGSDQVWNPYFKRASLPAQFLTFTGKEKRIAYAASFGVSAIPEKDKALFAKWLEGMAHISVRETQGKAIVKELTGRDVPVLVDPTMLLTREEWDKAAARPAWLEEGKKYILLYFLGGIPEEAGKEIRRIAEAEHLSVIDLLDSRRLDVYASDPGEFVYLIAHAALVYTDSFHGSVFSILYRRPFVICDRRMGSREESMNSRIDTLTALFGLEGRIGNGANHFAVEDPLTLDYPDVEAILDRERRKSTAFMKQALNQR